ncbi:MAG TPA: SMI1/KNR4 family protein [Symbiobacteriaceae bacterium]|jgi:hypothetical protein|nr:SMI1/KNR4 family protein [Symbiobacteriaceae bacterium]
MRDIAELQMTLVGPPVSEEAIRRFEKFVGLRLPVDYVSCLLQANGGYAERAYFRPEWAPEGVTPVARAFAEFIDRLFYVDPELL